MIEVLEISGRNAIFLTREFAETSKSEKLHFFPSLTKEKIKLLIRNIVQYWSNKFSIEIRWTVRNWERITNWNIRLWKRDESCVLSFGFDSIWILPLNWYFLLIYRNLLRHKCKPEKSRPEFIYLFMPYFYIVMEFCCVRCQPTWNQHIFQLLIFLSFVYKQYIFEIL